MPVLLFLAREHVSFVGQQAGITRQVLLCDVVNWSSARCNL
jgi:hypothetical protein